MQAQRNTSQCTVSQEEGGWESERMQHTVEGRGKGRGTHSRGARQRQGHAQSRGGAKAGARTVEGRGKGRGTHSRGAGQRPGRRGLGRPDSLQLAGTFPLPAHTHTHTHTRTHAHAHTHTRTHTYTHTQIVRACALSRFKGTVSRSPRSENTSRPPSGINSYMHNKHIYIHTHNRQA